MNLKDGVQTARFDFALTQRGHGQRDTLHVLDGAPRRYFDTLKYPAFGLTFLLVLGQGRGSQATDRG